MSHYYIYDPRHGVFIRYKVQEEQPNRIELNEDGVISPFGLWNIGNTCFMNSIIQCLLSLSSFTQNLDSLISESDNPQLLRAFQSLIQNPTKRSLENIKNLVSVENDHFYGNNQQDSFEFFISLVSSLENENKKGISDLFIGKLESKIICKKCHEECTNIQTTSSINLAIDESRRIFFIPFSLSKPIIKMPRPPQVGEYVQPNKFEIKDYVLMKKNENGFEIVSQISPEYPYTYAFELPKKINEGCGLAVVQLKTQEKIPITFPFLIEVPLGNIDEKELKRIIISRIQEYLLRASNPKTAGNGLDTRAYKMIENLIRFSKPISAFNLSEKSQICHEYITIHMPNCFEFRERKELIQEDEISFEELFNSSIKLTQFDPISKWNCDSCNRSSLSYQRCKYSELPKILTFQIKRSHFDNDRLIIDKTNIRIPKQITITDDQEYNTISIDQNDQRGLKYRLKAITHHGGSFDSGHYWAYCKRGKKWYSFNDCSARELKKNPYTPKSSSYVVFYEQVTNDQEQDDEEEFEPDNDVTADDNISYRELYSLHDNFYHNYYNSNYGNPYYGTNFNQNYYHSHNFHQNWQLNRRRSNSNTNLNNTMHYNWFNYFDGYY